MGAVVHTFTATIYVGQKVRATGEVKLTSVSRHALQDYVNRVGLCVTMTRTEFIYRNGSEPGLIIGLINYPRFPATPDQIRLHADNIAKILMKENKQLRVSIVYPDKTVMLSQEDEEEKEPKPAEKPDESFFLPGGARTLWLKLCVLRREHAALQKDHADLKAKVRGLLKEE